MPVSDQEAVAALPPPGWLRRYLYHALKQTTAPFAYHYGVGVSLLAVACPPSFGIHYAGSLRANQFSLLVGRSGEDRKSTALSIGKRVLDEAAPNLIGDYPGSAEGLIDSLAKRPTQLIPISEFGKFLSSAGGGYFEQTKTLLADVWDCLDSSTEILGERGWKRIGEVKRGQKVWAMDSKTQKLVLSEVLDAKCRPLRSTERMVRMKSRLHDIRTTEGHRFYVKYKDHRFGGHAPSREYQVRQGKDMAARKSAFFLPLAVPPSNPPQGCRLTNEEVKALGNLRQVTPELPKMNKRQFTLYWAAVRRTDEAQLRGFIETKDRAFVDAVQQAATLLGISSAYTLKGHTYRLSLSERTLVCTTPSNPKSTKFEYDDDTMKGELVWCATTEHGTLVTRRNGKIVILGNCGPAQRAKANNKVVRVASPRLTIAAACSVPYLEKHTLAEDWSGGFMGRWLVMYGRRERIDPNPKGDMSDFQWLADELKARILAGKGGWCLGFDPPALQMWKDWYYTVMARQLPTNIVGIRARAPTLALKIALLYGWDFGPARHCDRWYIDVDVLEPALRLAELHIQSLVSLAEVIAEHQDARLRRSVLRAIENHSGVATLGEILGVMKMRKRIVLEVLDALIEEGRVTRVNTTMAGRDAYQVNAIIVP